MAFSHGKSAKVYLGAVDISGYLNNVAFSGEAPVADTTTFGTTWKSGLTGHTSGSAEFAGFYDAANAQADRLALLSPGVLTICPVGASIVGNPARLFNAYDSAYSESTPVAGIVAIAGTWMADGTVGVGAILHPLGADTDTTVGSSRNDGAATSTGWTAHLHVTDVSDGSWTVKLEDSANNSDWTDLTAGAFTAATDATSQRLVGASGATLRRYVRYTATRSGGDDTDTLTFVLAYARN